MKYLSIIVCGVVLLLSCNKDNNESGNRGRVLDAYTVTYDLNYNCNVGGTVNTNLQFEMNIGAYGDASTDSVLISTDEYDTPFYGFVADSTITAENEAGNCFFFATINNDGDDLVVNLSCNPSSLDEFLVNACSGQGVNSFLVNEITAER